MLLQDIANQVQYVVDGEGNQSAIQLDIDTWQKLLALLQQTPPEYGVGSNNHTLSQVAESRQGNYRAGDDSAVVADEISKDELDNENAQSLIMEFPANVIGALHAPLDELDKEFRKELALVFYQQHRISVGKAKEFAQMTRWEFEDLLGERKIIRQYTQENLLEDINYGLSDQ